MKLQYSHPQKDRKVKQTHSRRILLSCLFGAAEKKKTMREKRGTTANLVAFFSPQFLFHFFFSFFLLFVLLLFLLPFSSASFDSSFVKMNWLNFRIWLVALGILLLIPSGKPSKQHSVLHIPNVTMTHNFTNSQCHQSNHHKFPFPIEPPRKKGTIFAFASSFVLSYHHIQLVKPLCQYNHSYMIKFPNQKCQEVQRDFWGHGPLPWPGLSRL